jgi:uncharacterized protein YggT (Ycf19 family)
MIYRSAFAFLLALDCKLWFWVLLTAFYLAVLITNIVVQAKNLDSKWAKVVESISFYIFLNIPANLIDGWLYNLTGKDFSIILSIVCVALAVWWYEK